MVRVSAVAIAGETGIKKVFQREKTSCAGNWYLQNSRKPKLLRRRGSLSDANCAEGHAGGSWETSGVGAATDCVVVAVGGAGRRAEGEDGEMP